MPLTGDGMLLSSDLEFPDSAQSCDLPSDSESLCSLEDNTLTEADSEPGQSLAGTSIGQPDESISDIGCILAPSNSISEICQLLDGISNAKKCHLLFHHVQPPTSLPTTFSHGCHRKFNIDWLRKYPWLRYSVKLDGVFCGPCALFLSESRRNDKGLLVNRPFSNWVKISEALQKHSKHFYPCDCVQLTDAIKVSLENPASRVDMMLSRSLQSQMTENKHILQQIVRGIIFLARQGLPLRGHRENAVPKSNPGNFLALLKSYAEVDSILHKHLNQPNARNVTYLSPASQNEVINVIGYDIIRTNLITEVKKARFFSILADEVSCHNREYLALCLRFVDEACDIREEFVAFIQLSRVRATDIANAIISTVEELGLSLQDLRGQGYDGASTMSGEKSGVQK
jgi:hypothetical protein